MVTVQREKDGAIEFYRIKFYLRSHSSQVKNWSDDRWLACLAAGGGSKRRFQYCSDDSGTIIYLRALQGHSGNNLIHPTLQDNVMIGTGIFPYIYHIGCTFNLHSTINNGLSEVRMSRFFGCVFHGPNGHNHGATLKIQWYFLNEICTVSHSQAFLWERPFEDVLLEVGWEQSTELGMSLCSSTTRIILIGLRGRHQS